ncbi:FecR family protein [Flagellimonas sp.]|uniref:FecR family protein n=1 Tax=Flagellimonas sp. TaxID=2058762 RepID=UPI003B50056D
MENKLINKYLSGRATEDEIKTIFDWVDASPKNKHEFIELKKIWSLSMEVDGDKEEAWKQVQKRLIRLKRKKNITNTFKYAAIFVVGLGLAAGLLYDKVVVQLPADQIVLELSDGTKKIIKSDGSQEIIGTDGKLLGRQEEDGISYSNTEINPQEGEVAYNTLYIPYSKRFNLVLSDGTKIQLNSGATLKYPVKFMKGASREVFLDGEAYFEVTEDKSREFVVRANGLTTRVYGTKFNVNCYKDDDVHEVVLVSGSIGVQRDSTNTEELLLKPNEKASLGKDGRLYRESVDVSGYIAWIDGVLVFENERLENILRKLERHYDVSIKNNYTAINDNRYTGYFDIESVDDILRTFSKHKPFVYEVNGHDITINP